MPSDSVDLVFTSPPYAEVKKRVRKMDAADKYGHVNLDSYADWFIDTAFTEPGGLVCDPFAGSGTALAVAKAMGRHYIGCDIVPEFVKAAELRIKHMTINKYADAGGTAPPTAFIEGDEDGTGETDSGS